MARKDVHSLVSGMGGACSIVETIVREARDCGVSDEDIHNLTTEKGRKIIRGWVQSLKKVGKSILTLAERITACKLDWFDQDILTWRREDEPGEPRGEVELLDLGRNISTKDALATIAKQNGDPANIEELCDFGTKNPKAQRKNPIVALGSVFVLPADGRRCSPCLCERGAERELGLDSRGGGWGAFYRFAVVRKGTR